MFQQMVDYTEPICQQIDSSLAQILTFDTSGIELYVTENNPKTLNALIRKLKVYYKDIPDVDPYKMAYGLMPSQAASCPDAKQQYINGHFCYADKFAILTNGLGIIRHISFLDDDFKTAHPEMTIEKKSDSPDEDKSIGDATSLKPVLSAMPDGSPDAHIRTLWMVPLKMAAPYTLRPHQYQSLLYGQKYPAACGSACPVLPGT